MLHIYLTRVGRAVVIRYDLTYNLREDELKIQISEIGEELCEKKSEKASSIKERQEMGRKPQSNKVREVY